MNLGLGWPVLFTMMVSSATARISNITRSLVKAAVENSRHIVAAAFGSDDERLPSNVERHGQHLLVRATVPHSRPGSRFSSGPGRYQQ